MLQDKLHVFCCPYFHVFIQYQTWTKVKTLSLWVQTYFPSSFLSTQVERSDYWKYVCAHNLQKSFVLTANCTGYRVYAYSFSAHLQMNTAVLMLKPFSLITVFLSNRRNASASLLGEVSYFFPCNWSWEWSIKLKKDTIL